jgi:hypothetical protein
MRRDLLAALLVIGVADCAIQQEQGEAWRHEMKAAAVTWQRVGKETDNPFEARRQAMLEHSAFFASSPEAARRLDMLTAIMWQLQGGEYAGAVCYMRGFQFGTAHHDQCVYEVKMEGGTGFSEPAAPSPASRAPRPREKWPPPAVVGGVEQGGKVYDPSECIGPVIMGRCHGSILPNKAYHPTCHGTWLNGHCTGPMF